MYKQKILFALLAFALVSYGATVLAQNTTRAVIITNPATEIQASTAVLNGTIANLPEDTVTVWFQYGQDTNYGTETQHTDQSEADDFNANITNLTQGATYHFRAVVQDSTGLLYGDDQTFVAGDTQDVQTLPYISTLAPMQQVPTDVSTGLTNNIFLDSFFFPTLLIMGGAWLYFSGRLNKFADWIGNKIK